jgi:hypothetical protein
LPRPLVGASEERGATPRSNALVTFIISTYS